VPDRRGAAFERRAVTDGTGFLKCDLRHVKKTRENNIEYQILGMRDDSDHFSDRSDQFLKGICHAAPSRNYYGSVMGNYQESGIIRSRISTYEASQ
jgi:hypothetical protein